MKRRKIKLKKYTKKSPKFFENIREVNGVKERRCSKCKEWFPETTEYYYMHNKSKPERGYQSECKKCAIKRSDKIQKDNPERTKYYKDSHYYKNIDIWVDRQRIYNKKHAEQIAIKEKEWAKNNPDKMKRYAQNRYHHNHDISTKEWKACQEYFNYVCAYCGKTLEQQYKQNNHQFHKEHVDHEGYNDVRNCVPACTNCNSTKKEKTIEHLFNINIISTFTQDRYDKIMLWCNEDYKQYIEEKPPYKIKHSRIYREDGTYYLQAELWIVDNKRNFIKCIATEVKKKDLNLHIQKYFGYM